MSFGRFGWRIVLPFGDKKPFGVFQDPDKFCLQFFVENRLVAVRDGRVELVDVSLLYFLVAHRQRNRVNEIEVLSLTLLDFDFGLRNSLAGVYQRRLLWSNYMKKN